MRVAAIVFLFLIRLRFPKSKSISDIIRRIIGLIGFSGNSHKKSFYVIFSEAASH